MIKFLNQYFMLIQITVAPPPLRLVWGKWALGQLGGILGLDLDQKTVLPTRDPVYFDVGGSADC